MDALVCTLAFDIVEEALVLLQRRRPKARFSRLGSLPKHGSISHGVTKGAFL